MSISFDDLTSDRSFTTGGKVDGQASFLPEPERKERFYTIISADDHIVEPPDTFAGRLPAGLAERIGDKSVVILANHGIIVTAATVPEATYKAATIDRQCQLMYDVATSGRPYTVLPDTFLGPMKRSLVERGPAYFWGGAVRLLLRREPEVLSS